VVAAWEQQTAQSAPNGSRLSGAA